MKATKVLLALLFLISANLSYADEKPLVEAQSTGSGLSGSDKLGQFGFGVGIGVNSLDSERDVRKAIVDSSNVVRITDASKENVNFWLESHYTFGGSYKSYRCGSPDDSGKYGDYVCYNGKTDANGEPTYVKAGESFLLPRKSFVSVFFAVNVSDSESIIRGAAIGPMWSLRQIDRKTGKPTDRFFNIGIGPSITKVQKVMGGLSDGQSVPAGTQIDYTTDMEAGVALIFSVGVM